MKLRAYLDMETTGLSRYYADLTVIGVALEKDRLFSRFRLLKAVIQ